MLPQIGGPLDVAVGVTFMPLMACTLAMSVHLQRMCRFDARRLYPIPLDGYRALDRKAWGSLGEADRGRLADPPILHRYEIPAPSSSES